MSAQRTIWLLCAALVLSQPAAGLAAVLSRARPTTATAREQFLAGVAQSIAVSSACDRKQVGAVLSDGWGRVLSAGFNDSPAGTPNCREAGHLLVHTVEHGAACTRNAHAETTAIANAARRGTAVDGATLVTTLSTCWECFKVAQRAGVARQVYVKPYGKAFAQVAEASQRAGVPMVRVAPRSDPTPQNAEERLAWAMAHHLAGAGPPPAVALRVAGWADRSLRNLRTAVGLGRTETIPP